MEYKEALYFITHNGATLAEETISYQMMVEAMEKQIPKKPIYTNEGTVTRCPICEAVHFRCLSSVEVDYCVRCGQAIDWSEVE